MRATQKTAPECFEAQRNTRTIIEEWHRSLTEFVGPPQHRESSDLALISHMYHPCFFHLVETLRQIFFTGDWGRETGAECIHV